MGKRETESKTVGLREWRKESESADRLEIVMEGWVWNGTGYVNYLAKCEIKGPMNV